MKFYVGLHHPSDAGHFERCLVNANALRGRVSNFPANEWILDSGAFTQVTKHGRFLESPEEYAGAARRWWRCGYLAAAVSQDFMCEPVALAKTGLTVPEHQRLTVERYDVIRRCLAPLVYVMPVLQGYEPSEYVAHVRQYGDRLREGAWVGVGSVCKRNANVAAIERVLGAIRAERPDLKLHGFGVKLTALASSVVRDCLFSADSSAWSFAARYEGRDRHAWAEAEAFRRRIDGQPVRQRYLQAHLYDRLPIDKRAPLADA